MIVVIAILAGLLVPAVLAAIIAAQNAATIAETNGLANSLAAFKDRYGSYPPSRIMLNETMPFAQYGLIPGGDGVAPARPGHASGFWIGTGPVTGTDAGSDITIAAARRAVLALHATVFPARGQRSVHEHAGGTFWYDFNGNGVADAAGGFGVAGVAGSTSRDTNASCSSWAGSPARHSTRIPPSPSA